MITAELGAAARMFEEPVFGSIIYIMRNMGRRAAWCGAHCSALPGVLVALASCQLHSDFSGLYPAASDRRTRNR
jgi:hypothetical protein